MSNIDAVKKYQEKRDSIMLRPSKEDGQIIRDTAKAAGQSVQAYILQAIKERMERDSAGNDTADGFGISEPETKDS
ncbi:MAG: hypothetical protein ACI3VA_05805 [Candidatus Limivicinus sp.]